MARFTRSHRRLPAPPDAPAPGFALIEVLIALFVIAVALAAVLAAMGTAIDNSSTLRDRTVALWAAQERAVQLQVQRAWPAIDTTEGTVEMAGREWRWRERVSTTEVPEIRRVDIEIRAPRSPDVLAQLAIFLPQP